MRGDRRRGEWGLPGVENPGGENLNPGKDGLTGSGYYRKGGGDEVKRFRAFKERSRKIKNVYLAIAVTLTIIALGVGFLYDRNLGLIVIIIAALVVFAGGMYVYFLFKRGMG